MDENRINTRRIENYKGYIKAILSNRDIDCEEPWWEHENAQIELEKLVNAKNWKIADSDQMGIDSSEMFLFLKFTQAGQTKVMLENLGEAACALARKPTSDQKNIYIICIVDNMKSRVFLEKTFLSDDGKAMKKKIRRELKSWRGTVNFLYILDNHYSEQDIKLTHLNRFDFIQMPPLKNHITWEKEDDPEGVNHGYVTSVDLFQLVEIYNKIGDRLFKRNVRYGLNEQLGVDRAIRDTLKNSPEEFWFKNNGVTILVEWPEFKLDRVEEVLLEHIKEYGELLFSVINGAQTITAAAQCFYEMEYERNLLSKANEKADPKKLEKLDDKIKKSKAAKVLLRILHIPRRELKSEQTTNQTTREVNEISVALNRQKPIKAEDIAFASPFVEKLAAFLEREQENGKRYFSLVKRGEGSQASRAMDLADFSRARKACAMDPGDARSKGTNALLSFKNESDGESNFKDEVIFIPEWMDAEEEQEEEVFKKYYGAVNFAVKIANYYEKCEKELTKQVADPLPQTVLQNGKWYFTAFMVQLFNGFDDDFSTFTDNFDLIREKLSDLILLFASQCAAVVQKHETEYPKFDSNVFKKNTLFHQVLKEADYRQFDHTINSGLEDDEIIELKLYENEEPGTLSGAGDKQSQNLEMRKGRRQAANKVKSIILNGESTEWVSSTAHAMIKTVQFILDNYPGYESLLLSREGDWFTDDEKRAEERYGYLRRPVEVTGEKGKSFWIGTHSDSNTKYNQIRELCQIVGVEKNTIRWLAADGKTLLFSW